MAFKPIAGQKILRRVTKRVEEDEPDIPPQAQPERAAARPPKKAEEAERDATRGADLRGEGDGAAAAAGGSGRFDAALGRGATGEKDVASAFVDRNARPGSKRPDAESVVDDARAEVAAGRAGRGGALEDLAERSAGGGRGTGDTAATDGKTSVTEMGKGGISSDSEPIDPNMPPLADLEGNDVPGTSGAELEAQRLFEEELAKDLFEAELAKDNAPKGAGGGASRPLPDGDRFDPDSRGGQVAESLRASMAPRGGGGDGVTDPVNTGGLGQVVAGAALTDTKGTLLGGDTRGATGESGVGTGVPDRDAGRIDPAEGDDTGGGVGRESDPFADAPDARRDLDAARPTGQDDADDSGDDGADGGGLGAAVLAERSVLASSPVAHLDLSGAAEDDGTDDDPDDEADAAG